MIKKKATDSADFERLLKLLDEWQKDSRWQEYDYRIRNWQDAAKTLQDDQEFWNRRSFLKRGEVFEHLESDVDDSRSLVQARADEINELSKLLQRFTPELVTRFWHPIENGRSIEERANVVRSIHDELAKRQKASSSTRRLFMTIAELAEHFNLSEDAVNGRLKKLTQGQRDAMRSQNTIKQKGEPDYFWRVADVEPILTHRD